MGHVSSCIACAVAVAFSLPTVVSRAAEEPAIAWAVQLPVSSAAGESVGPDVVLSFIHGTGASMGIGNYGSEDPSGTGDFIAGFSVGTTSCNWGDLPIPWITCGTPALGCSENTEHHPVIRQNAYRLKNSRFEQIGTSWVKHGFYAVNDNGCGGGCSNPGAGGGIELRPNCSDPYTYELNAGRTYLGPTFEINAFTGEFPMPHTAAAGSGAIRHRVQIRHTDLDPALNPGAAYFVEGHYVSPDDAAFGNGENNASYRRAFVRAQGQPLLGDSTCGRPYCMMTDPSHMTQVTRPAIRAWKDIDPTVNETDARVPGEGLFILSEKTTDLGTGFFRYEYALYNLNSDRSAGSFTVPLPQNAIVQNIGFHDVHHHSGEPWGTNDWLASIANDKLTWTTAPYVQNPNANALRWSTLYNFRFDTNQPPGDSHVEVGLFKPGFPTGIAIRTIGPLRTIIDCNGNGVDDRCDVADASRCAELGCFPETCGLYADCNDNGVPDDPLCEDDCNLNGVPDECDIRDCWMCVGGETPGVVCGDDGDCCADDMDCPPGLCKLSDPACGDCQPNTVPDGCEDDCDGDTIPDSCEEDLDADDDGFEDCEDECPYNTPPGGCDPPPSVTCRYNTGFCATLSWQNCILQGGTPVCGDPPEYRCMFGTPCPESSCRDGCLIGDWDLDGDIDLIDAGHFQGCFSGDFAESGYILPSPDCSTRFDFESDGDVDLSDLDELIDGLTDPKG